VKDYKIVNMFDAGILDTAKGVKNALINAASASNNLLRTNNAITLKRFAKDGN
jgi:chaperonin GroEL (HSP60 family)